MSSAFAALPDLELFDTSTVYVYGSNSAPLLAAELKKQRGQQHQCSGPPCTNSTSSTFALKNGK